jgi:3-oxoadipate enol-lactonase
VDYITLEDGARLAAVTDGDESLPSLIFSNSVGTDRRLWEGQASALSERFHIVRYDTRGHGQSSSAPEPKTIDRLGADLLAVLDHYRIERAHVCGLSLGGLTAMWVAAMHPERVSRVVLANTAARIGSVEWWNTRIDAVRTGGMSSIRDIVLSRFFTESFRESHPEAANPFGDRLEALDPAGYIAACEVLRDTDVHPLLPRIKTPTLVIGGAFDPSTPVSQAVELHEAIAGSRLVVLENAAHLSNIEQPGQFNAALLQFLDGAG